MNRRKLLSLLVPLGLVVLWPKSSKAQKVQKERYLMPGQYDQRTTQDAFDKISRRLQEGGL